MSDGNGPNCILAVCCPPQSEGQVNALAQEMAEQFTGDGALLDPDVALRDIAEWVLQHFDLAPKGTLQAFKDSIRDHAREGYARVEPRAATEL